MMKACIFSVCGVLLALQFKTEKSEYGLYIILAVSIVLGFLGLAGFVPIMTVLEKMEEMMNIKDGYLKIFMKMLGISYLVEFAAALCQDAGYGTLASQLEMLGKLTILSISSPILLALLEMLETMLI